MRIFIGLRWALPVISACILAFFATQAQASSLNSWRLSCGADKGSVTRKGGTWRFATSSNKCPGGIFKQRAEIASGRVSPSHKGSYRFQAYVAMKSSKSNKFGIFQIHDGRRGCAPPLKLDVLSSGQIRLTSDVKTGPGESCIRGSLSSKVTRARIRRNGKEQKLEVLVKFDGKGGFDVTVSINGAAQIKGKYQPREKANYRSKFFYFKHGVYSQRKFPYVMTSRGMSVRRVR